MSEGGESARPVDPLIEIKDSSGPARRAFGLYVVIAYAIVIAVPRNLSLPTRLPVGRFTLEGHVAQAAFALWSAAWLAMVVGLALRTAWGYRLALVVFGLHVLLVGSNTLRWLADNRAPVSMALEVAVWPSLQWILADLLAMAYLYERRHVFGRATDRVG